MSETFLTFTAVARKAKITRRTLYNWQQSGRFNVPPIDDHKPARWRNSDIERWINPARTDATNQAVGE